MLAAAAALVALMFFLVVGADDADQATGDGVVAGPSGAVDGTDATEAVGFGATDGAADGDLSELNADSGQAGAPEPLVVTPSGADGADATTTSGPTTTVATTASSATTVASTAATTAPSTTVAPSTTMPPSTEAQTTQAEATETTAAPTTVAVTPGPSGGDAAFQQEVANLTNAERAANGCGPVALDPTLNAVADAHSEDMAANNYFDHTGLNGSKPWDRVAAAGYPAGGSGENIAQGYATAASVVAGWMDSPGHRANILNCSWTELGVGYAEGANPRNNVPPLYWTQVFATRR
jgi:uncharacterized protein YkwD